jgi:hypothetical protein
MGWLMSGREVISDWFSQPREAQPVAQPQRMEALHRAMLAALGEAGLSSHLRLALRIRATTDPLALWFLRAELMTALSLQHGEPSARETVAGLGALFHGLLPGGMQEAARRAGPGANVVHG